tara:strand:- start:687 stop:1280 length:594 start_codon:yes stop_codon:yes gene_type:complete
MSKENNNPCGCNCNISEDIDSSKRDFIKRATAITVIGGTAFILEACGGGGSPTGPEDNNDGDNGGGDNGGGDNGGGSGGDTGYNYDATTGTITIDISKIHTTLQTVGAGIMLSSNITFDDRGIIVLRTSGNSVKALSRRCTHQGNVVNIDAANNNLLCPSHDSVFDFNGNVISGPASSSLAQYSASINGNIITITSS